MKAKASPPITSGQDTIPLRHVLEIFNSVGPWSFVPGASATVNAKVSPVDVLDGMEFEGYVWEGVHAYAYFRSINTDQTLVRGHAPAAAKREITSGRS